MLRVPYLRRGVTFPPTFTDAVGCGADLRRKGEKPVGVCVCPYHRYKIKKRDMFPLLIVYTIVQLFVSQGILLPNSSSSPRR